MLVGAVLLVLQVSITNYLDWKERAKGEPPQPEAADQEQADELESPELKEESAPKGEGAFALVFQTRYLLLIAFLLMFLNWVNTTGEYILGSVVEDAARAAVAQGQAGGLSVEQFIGQFYSRFFGVVNVAGVLIQLFLVSRIFKYLGVHIAVMILPCIALGAYSILAFYPILAAIRWAKTAENSTDYSLNNTVRNVLFLPCTRAQKYSAKQAIDSFFVRSGDVLSALTVFIGTTYFALQASGFAKFNIGLVLVWLVVALSIGRQYKHLAATGRPPS